MKFAHITPSAYLDVFAHSKLFHLLLADLVDKDDKYRYWYAHYKKVCPHLTYILDNGMFERFKAGLPPLPPDTLMKMAEIVRADYVVLPDYPGENSYLTIEAAKNLAPIYKEKGFGTVFVPQAYAGDVDQLINAFEWGIANPNIDYIALSILSAPLAYNVESGNKLQRFLSRWHFLRALESRGTLTRLAESEKKFHLLGMVDGPNEIALLRDYHWMITSWDSSAAVWAGLNGISFDQSPTGLIDGKYETPVDFTHTGATKQQLDLAGKNIAFIDEMVG